MRRAWVVWLSVTLFISLYLGAGYIESYPFETTIKLEPGYVARMTIVRVAADPALMSLVFPEDNHRRPELGFSEVAKPWPASEEKRYLRPGAAIHLRVMAGPQAVDYEAEPAYGTSRMLTSNRSIAPGVWRWPPPPDLPKIILSSGVTELSVQVIAVDVPLVGQSVRFFVYPPLSFKTSKNDAGWVGILAFGIFLWPALLVVQVLWAGLLLVQRRSPSPRPR